MEGHSDQIVVQLRAIKWLLALISVACMAHVGARVWEILDARQYRNEIDLKISGDSHDSMLSKMLEEGQELEVLKSCSDIIQKLPRHARAHYYCGRAHYQLGHFSDALAFMVKAQELAPTFEKETTGPYINAIERALAKKK